MLVTAAEVAGILTRSSGFLATVCSHSLQPYRGCALGNSLCGVGCYVRHNVYLTKGEPWGSFVESRTNAAAVYRSQYAREREWARKRRGRFSIFMSSSTEPFQPIEKKARITRSVLEAMLECPPDELIVQTHSPMVAEYLDLYLRLNPITSLRFHISIESDRDELPGLPRSASPVSKRIEAARTLHEAGLRVVITVAPLLPIDDPDGFFQSLRDVADAIVFDHFIGGDGSSDGSRTKRTALPVAMTHLDPRSATLEYRDEMIAIAKRYFGENVGVNIDGFAGRFSSTSSIAPEPAQERPCDRPVPSPPPRPVGRRPGR